MAQHNVEIQIAQSFFESMYELPKTTQRKVQNFIEKFKENPKSNAINYETIENSAHPDMRSVRIDQSYRGIILKPSTGNVYTLLWVDTHDAAYDWALTHRVQSQTLDNSLGYSPIKSDLITFSEEKINLLKRTNLKDLVTLGIPLEIMDDIRQVNTIEELRNYELHLSPLTYIKLEQYLNGHPLSEVLKITLDKENPFVIIEDDTELEKMIMKPSEAWRLFLHPKQTDLVSKSFKGSFKLLGAAGTGKTVVALHRARALQGKLGPKEQLLFTTFTTTLCHDIKMRLEKLMSAENLKQVVVTNLDQWVADFIKQERLLRTVIMNPSSIWSAAINKAGLTDKYNPEFLIDEWNQVICPNNIQTIEEYLTASRVQVSKRLDRVHKAEVFQIVLTYREMMIQQALFDPEWAKLNLIDVIKKRYPNGLFRFIIVDEAQDMTSTSFRLIRALAGPEQPDDIFIVGDSRQRIYKSKASLKNCGILIQGNTKTLSINYRTTDSIYRLASTVIKDEEFDDLDGEVLGKSEVQSLMLGDDPEVKCFESFTDEVLAIKTRIEALKAKGSEMKDILVCSRTNNQVEEYFEKLKQLGVSGVLFSNENSNMDLVEGIRFATMHRIKGLEFDHIILVGMNDEMLPLRSVEEKLESDLEKHQFELQEKSLLYVAMTRAKYSLMITGVKQLTRFIRKE